MKRTALALAVIGNLALASQATAAGVTVSAPDVPRNIKKATGYFASVTVNLPKGSRVSGVFWSWSGEGPYPIPFKYRGNTVTSRLITRNPGDYRLAAKVCYWHQEKRYCAQGKSTLIRVR